MLRYAQHDVTCHVPPCFDVLSPRVTFSFDWTRVVIKAMSRKVDGHVPLTPNVAPDKMRDVSRPFGMWGKV